MGDGGGGGGFLISALFEKAESYLGRGDASMALTISSLKVASERTDGRTLDCCILRYCGNSPERCTKIEV